MRPSDLRARILAELKIGPQRKAALAEAMGCGESTLHQALNDLLEAGLIRVNNVPGRRGQTIKQWTLVSTDHRLEVSKLRHCLCCRREFVSQHSMQRLCLYCRSTASLTPFDFSPN